MPSKSKKKGKLNCDVEMKYTQKLTPEQKNLLPHLNWFNEEMMLPGLEISMLSYQILLELKEIIGIVILSLIKHYNIDRSEYYTSLKSIPSIMHQDNENTVNGIMAFLIITIMSIYVDTINAVSVHGWKEYWRSNAIVGLKLVIGVIAAFLVVFETDALRDDNTHLFFKALLLLKITNLQSVIFQNLNKKNFDYYDQLYVWTINNFFIIDFVQIGIFLLYVMEFSSLEQNKVKDWDKVDYIMVQHYLIFTSGLCWFWKQMKETF